MIVVNRIDAIVNIRNRMNIVCSLMEARYRMQSAPVMYFFSLCLLILSCTHAVGKPSASIKFSILRAENEDKAKETLVLPFGFPSESMGTTIGVGALAKGYGQEQLLIAGATWASFDEAIGGVVGLWDYKLPYVERLFFSTIGSVGHYPRQKAFTSLERNPDSKGAGGNDSDKDDFIREEGDDNWFEAKIEYVLPIGSMKNENLATYRLKNGLLVSGSTGGDTWNPFKSGVTVFVLRQFNRYQSYQTEDGKIDGTIHPIEFGLLYNNTDFAPNPSTGSSQYISLIQDYGWGDSLDKWTFLSFEASKYFDLGSNRYSRQQVLALNFWTGDSPTWEVETLEDGSKTVVDDPPFLEGAKLGGFYRLRAYPSNRFNGRSVLYSTAEYRFTMDYNPTEHVSWLDFLKLDWFQLVGFIEGGRVAGEYDLSELLSDWKCDVGIGLRAMVAGGVVRFDIATSAESTTAWVMFGHPF